MRIEKKGEVVEVEIKACGSEYLDLSPEKAKFQLSKEDVEFILKAASICAENGFSHVAAWDDRVEYLLEEGGDVSEAGLRLENGRIMICERAFHFVSYERHSDMKIWTDSVYISALVAAMEGRS